MPEDRASVCCVMPCRTVPDPLAFKALQVAAAAYGAPFDTPAREPRERNRNQAVAQFIEHQAFNWLLFVDDDTTVPEDVIERLLAVRRKIVCGIQPLLLQPGDGPHLVVNVMTYPTAEHTRPHWPDWLTWERPAGPFPVWRCGFGCVLIHRDVLTATGFPWFVEDYGDAQGRNNITEDIYFCERVNRAGFDIWCRADVVCGHYKKVDLREIVPRQRVNLGAGDPAPPTD